MKLVDVLQTRRYISLPEIMNFGENVVWKFLMESVCCFSCILTMCGCSRKFVGATQFDVTTTLSQGVLKGGQITLSPSSNDNRIVRERQEECDQRQRHTYKDQDIF